jgi:hypothetical protein
MVAVGNWREGRNDGKQKKRGRSELARKESTATI